MSFLTDNKEPCELCMSYFDMDMLKKVEIGKYHTVYICIYCARKIEEAEYADDDVTSV